MLSGVVMASKTKHIPHQEQVCRFFNYPAKHTQADRKAYRNVRCQPQELLECSNQLACQRQGFLHATGCNAAGGLPDHPSMVKGCCGNEPRALLGCQCSKLLSILHAGFVSKPSCLTGRLLKLKYRC